MWQISMHRILEGCRSARSRARKESLGLAVRLSIDSEPSEPQAAPEMMPTEGSKIHVRCTISESCGGRRMHLGLWFCHPVESQNCGFLKWISKRRLRLKLFAAPPRSSSLPIIIVSKFCRDRALIALCPLSRSRYLSTVTKRFLQSCSDIQLTSSAQPRPRWGHSIPFPPPCIAGAL